MTRVACVIIGRNEGERLVACLASVPQGLGDVVYVDSGSTDGSVAAAEAAGARVVLLDTGTPFTAARARNAGVAALDGGHDYVQFNDGDCVLDPGWLCLYRRVCFRMVHAGGAGQGLWRRRDDAPVRVRGGGRAQPLADRGRGAGAVRAPARGGLAGLAAGGRDDPARRCHHPVRTVLEARTAQRPRLCRGCRDAWPPAGAARGCPDAPGAALGGGAAGVDRFDGSGFWTLGAAIVAGLPCAGGPAGPPLWRHGRGLGAQRPADGGQGRGGLGDLVVRSAWRAQDVDRV